jgi:MFS family permease
MMNPSSQPKLFNKNFLVLWIGLIQSNFGDAFFAVGALWLVYEITGSPYSASTILILEGLPKLLGLVAGAVIDRSNKKNLLIFGDIFRGVILIIAYVIYLSSALSVWHIYFVVALLNAASVFYTPALRSILPTIVPNHELPRANALIQTGQQLAKILGASIGGVILAVTSGPVAFLIDGISFIVAALAIALIQLPPEILTAQKRSAKQLLLDVKSGILFITKSVEMSSLFLVVALVNLILGPVNVALPIFASQVLGGGVVSLGYLESALASGMLLGGLVFGVATGNKLKYPRSITYGILGVALSLILLGFSATLLPALLFSALFTSFIPLLSVSLHTRVQRIVPLEFRGRVFASIDMVGNLALPLGAGIAGRLLELLPSNNIFSISGWAIVIAVLIWVVLSQRFIIEPISDEKPSKVESAFARRQRVSPRQQLLSRIIVTWVLSMLICMPIGGYLTYQLLPTFIDVRQISPANLAFDGRNVAFRDIFITEVARRHETFLMSSPNRLDAARMAYALLGVSSGDLSLDNAIRMTRETLSVVKTENNTDGNNGFFNWDNEVALTELIQNLQTNVSSVQPTDDSQITFSPERIGGFIILVLIAIAFWLLVYLLYETLRQRLG